MKKIIGNGILFTLNKDNEYFENGAVVFEDEKIIDFGDYKEMSDKYFADNYEFIDAKGNVIMPGFINSHHHFYSAMARGMDFKNDIAPTKNGTSELNHSYEHKTQNRKITA